MTKRLIAFMAVLVAASTMAWAQGSQIVKTVAVRGNVNINKDSILSALTRIKEGRAFSRADVDAEEDRILQMGWFKDVKIFTRDVSGTEVDIAVEVQENPIVKELRITGNTIVKTERLTEIILQTVTIGQVFNNRSVRPIRDAVTEAYTKAGYLVQIGALEPDPDVPGALLVAILEPTVGEIKLLGLNRTRPSTVERMLRTKPGKPFNIDMWQRDLQELYVTQWFDDIKAAAPQPTDTPGKFNLAVDFSEARTAQLGAGVALDPQSRFVGSVFYSDSNFQGRGHNVGFNLSQATAGGGPSVELAFGNRFYDAKDTQLNLQVFSKVVYNFTGSGTDPFGGGGAGGEEFNERRTGFLVNFNRPVSQKHRAFVGISGQAIKTVNLSSNPANEFIQQDGELAYLQLGYDYDTRRPSVEPYTGQFMRVLVEPGYSNITKIGGTVAANTEVLGANTFVRTTLEYRQYWSKALKAEEAFDKPRPVTAVRARYGFLSGTVPFFEQLFVGGANSLRGYDNQRFWGSQSFLASAEYRYPLQKSFNIIGFFDYGGAWDGYGRLRDFRQTTKPAFQMGYGLGAAFRTPLGPVRVDLAFNQNGGTKTHFYFGTSF